MSLYFGSSRQSEILNNFLSLPWMCIRDHHAAVTPSPDRDGTVHVEKGLK